MGGGFGNFGGSSMGGNGMMGGMMGGFGNMGGSNIGGNGMMGGMMGGSNFGGAGMMGGMGMFGDGSLSNEEAMKRLQSMYMMSDTDGDGALSIAEFEPMHAAMIRENMTSA